MPPASAGEEVQALMERLEAELKASNAPPGMGPGLRRLRMLDHLDVHPGDSVRQLAKCLGISLDTAQRMARQMEALGFMTVMQGPRGMLCAPKEYDLPQGGMWLALRWPELKELYKWLLAHTELSGVGVEQGTLVHYATKEWGWGHGRVKRLVARLRDVGLVKVEELAGGVKMLSAIRLPPLLEHGQVTPERGPTQPFRHSTPPGTGST